MSSPEDTDDINDDNNVDPVTRWMMQGNPWPKEYFEQENALNLLLESNSSSSSLDTKSETTDGLIRKGKTTAARSRLYEMTLEQVGIHMTGGPGVTSSCQDLCRSLLKTEQPLPPDSLFREDRFRKTCERLHNENEAKIIRDISPLLVPSVEVLCAFGA